MKSKIHEFNKKGNYTMNKTKAFSFTLMFILATSLSFAQSSDDSRTSFGVLGGINMQNLNGKDASGNTLENSIIIGYNVGINVQLPIVPQFYFQPGLMFSTKGAKNTETLITSTYKLSYIELPLNFVYKAQLGSGYIMLGFGPYLAYGIGGNATHVGGIINIDSKIEFQNEVDLAELLSATYFRPFDAGGNILFGYELSNGLFIQLNAQLGMLNLKPKVNGLSDDKATIKNTGFGLSLGYRF